MMEKIFDASILSWKTITATTGTIGNPTAVMELESTEDDSKINPTQPTVCIRDSSSPIPAEAPMVHMNPITYCTLETFVEFSESVLTTRRAEETVRRNKELTMKGVNFCELRKYEKKSSEGQLRGQDEGESRDWEANELKKCYHICAVTSIFIVQSTQNCSKWLAEDDKYCVNGDAEPPFTVLRLRYTRAFLYTQDKLH
ncbi:unnamed protein product [Arabidopsis lyrata]|nr:unnamed protein product [Arabidopsis lyrata]